MPDMVTIRSLAEELKWSPQKVRRAIWGLGLLPAEWRREVFMTKRGRRRAAVAYYEATVRLEIQRFESENNARAAMEATQPVPENETGFPPKTP